MRAFTPMGFEGLLAWALGGLERDRRVFALPERSFWRGRPGFDLSVAVPGGRAETPLGPAAGPHTQLAQNIVMAWLAGSRSIELRTVRALDGFESPRPSVDAPHEAYTVASSQELGLDQALEQYAIAWYLVHALAARGVAGPALQREVREGGGLAGTRFDASVGCDLAGVQSEAVTRFLDGLTDADARLAALRDSLPPELREAAAVAVPPRIVDTVALVTQRGVPAEEVEAMVEWLLERHGLHVVLRLDPTLLGLEGVAHLLHDVLGRRDIALDPAAFERGLGWDQAVAMLDRLASSAGRRGLRFGLKLTNGLPVRNTRRRLPGGSVSLSGPPLHPIAIALAHRLAGSGLGDLPLSFSAGVNAGNFAETIACGFAPVTACADLLQPSGYGRLPRYLESLEAEMVRTGTRDVGSYVRARALEREGAAAPEGVASAGAAGAPAALEAARRNLAAYAARLTESGQPAVRPPAAPRSEFTFAPPPGAADERPAMGLLDCDGCDRCAQACPNGAVFAIEAPARQAVTCDLVVRDHAIVREMSRFETQSQTQWVVDAGLCNACGNCDTFCAGYGGPHRVKPRLHRTRASYAAASPEDGILIEAGGDRVSSRFAGVEHYLERRHGAWLFGNHVVEANLDDEGFPLEARVVTPREGHRLELAHFHELLLLVTAVLRGANPVSASLPRE